MPNRPPGLSTWAFGAALWVECTAVAAAHACAPAGAVEAHLVEVASDEAAESARSFVRTARLAAGTDPEQPRDRFDRAVAAARAGEPRDLLRDALPCLRIVLERSRFGVSDQESAAWLVADPRSGELSCRLWPPTARRGEARWSGAMPRGVVAQIHSHPTRAASGRQWTPRPSQNDCRTARALAVPVLTVSVEGVYECRPADGRIVPHLGAGWDRVSEGGSA